MKYFRITNKTDPENTFYVSSSRDTDTEVEMEKILALSSHGFAVEACTKEEYDRETGDEDDLVSVEVEDDEVLDWDWDEEPSDEAWEWFMQDEYAED